MQAYKRPPLLNLQNQYTYLKGQQKKKLKNALLGFSQQLYEMNKLPLINVKKKNLNYNTNTTRRVQKELQGVQEAINQHNKRKYLISQHNQYAKPKIMPIYMPLSVNVPNMHMSMCASPMHNHSMCQHQCNQNTVLTPNDNKPSTNLQQAPNTVATPNQPVLQTIPNSSVPQANISSDLGSNKHQPQQLQRKPKQIHKFPQKSKTNRFRVAGYVVYFTLYARYFAKKFTQLRRNWFNQRYSINQGKIIYEGSAKILKHLYEIDIYKMLQSAKQKMKQVDLDDAKVSKSKTPDSVLSLIHFSTLLIDYVKQYMTSPSFILEHHEVFTVGVLTQNFMLNNLYLPQEAAILHIHEQGYILVEEETQIILLMLKIIVKIIVYNYLLGLKYSRQWNAKQEKSYGLDDTDMQQLWTMTRNTGLFLTIVCQQIYQKTYKQMSTSIYKYNFNEISPKFNILPAKALEQTKRTKSTKINPNDAYSKFIINLQGYSDMQQLINTFQPLKNFKQKIKLKLIDFLTVVYTALKYEEAKVYDFIRYLTLEEKYLIMKGVKQDMLNRKKKKKKKKVKDSEDLNKKEKKGKRKGNQRWQKGNNQSNQKSEGQSDNSNDSNQNTENRYDKQNNSGRKDSNNKQLDEEQSQKQQNEKKKKRRLRFKHQQLFFDHKFDGHYKLQKLKQKMNKKL